MILMMIILIVVMILIMIIVIIMVLLVVVVVVVVILLIIMIMMMIRTMRAEPGVGIKHSNPQWPQAKPDEDENNCLWQSTHKATGKRLHLSTRKDRHMLMVLYEDGKYLTSQRIDVCGAMAD